MTLGIPIHDILDNYIPKRALEIALVGNHSIYLNLPKTYKADDVGRELLLWGIDNGIDTHIGYENNPDHNCDICVDIYEPRPEVTNTYQEKEENVIARIENAILNEPDTTLDSISQRLLKSATTTLKLSENDIERLISVAVSIAKLSNEDLKVVHLAEALQYWGK